MKTLTAAQLLRADDWRAMTAALRDAGVEVMGLVGDRIKVGALYFSEMEEALAWMDSGAPRKLIEAARLKAEASEQQRIAALYP